MTLDENRNERTRSRIYDITSLSCNFLLIDKHQKQNKFYMFMLKIFCELIVYDN